MKTRTTFAALFLAAAVAQAAEVKLGYVDLQRALLEVGEGKEAKARLKAEMEKRKAEFERDNAKLRDDKLVLDKQSSMMSEEVRVQKFTELQKRLVDLAQRGEKMQLELAEKERVELRKIFDKMDPIIAAIAQREGLTVVLEKTDSGLLYALPSIDFTNELVRTYNDKNPVKGGKPATPAPAPKDAPAK